MQPNLAISGQTYQNLLQYVKDIVQLRSRLMIQNPDQKDLNEYKLLEKCFGAFYRIKNDPHILLDSILKMPNVSNVQHMAFVPNVSSTQLPSTKLDESGTQKAVMYMFGNNDQPENKTVQSLSSLESDDDKEMKELFLSDDERESLPDDIDVLKRFKISEIKLNRAISEKKYVIIDDDESESENNLE